MVEYKILTADLAARLELGCHGWIHRNHDLLFVGHQSVPFLDLVVDPCFELIANDSGKNIDYPLLRDLL